MDLFTELEQENRSRHMPLAARMRPTILSEFVGQEHILGEGKLLKRMIHSRRITSVIFFGPPGVGKTTLSQLIADHVEAGFYQLNASSCGVKEVREIIEEAELYLASKAKQTVLFLDEIHAFHRNQQDILLPFVENGTIVLIGATTQNPFFAINAPLLSRSQIFEFQPLTEFEIEEIVVHALNDPHRGFGKLDIEIDDEAIRHWATISDGDARRALTALEIAVYSFPVGEKIHIDLSVAEESIQKKAMRFDATGDEHYDFVSAYIKSMRGSDPDASIYWLARLLESGEEPRFLARRLVIFASEDIGLADSQALLIAEATHRAVEFVGMPECALNLAHATLYMATAPKSNSSTIALGKAKNEVQSGRSFAVPDHLKDSHYKSAAKLGHGVGYKYPHDYPNGYVHQQYLPEQVQLYTPTDHGKEQTIAEFLSKLKNLGGNNLEKTIDQI